MIDPAATGLPVADVVGQLTDALSDGPNAVLVAPPGAGKTTLIPLVLLDAPWAKTGKVVVLEPRRLAARAAAKRMASMLGERTGETVGYRMRLDSKVGPSTRIEVVTEGVFARMILDDPELSGVCAVIFDEFHERSLDADFSLALALDAQSGLREDLRLIVMSATLDGGRVAALMNDAPVIESKGRSNPVEIRYQARPPGTRIEDTMANVIGAALRDEQGSILAFLPGQAEVRRTAERLAGHLPGDAIVAPLYGAMDIKDQDVAILPPPPGQRKIVLATAIAESSVTIDGVRVVIDSGLARRPTFEPGMAITRLETGRVSRASADQRAGRAGRTQAGIAIRLWHEGQTAALPPFDAPEITRTDLSRLVLDCLVWGVADPRSLRFIDPPPEPALNEARAQLREIGAIDGRGRISERGQRLRSLPLPVPLAAMVEAANTREGAKRRARLAVLITERGLGGSSVDLDHRLANFEADRSPRARQGRQLADRLSTQLSKSAGEPEQQESAGVMLLDGFADRMAKARPGTNGRFVMANGRGVMVDEVDALARASFIVAADVTGKASGARVLAGAAVEETEIEARLAERIKARREVRFDPGSNRLIARQVRSLGAVVLSSVPQPVGSGPEAEAALLAAVRQNGLDVLSWNKAAQGLRARLAWLHARLGSPWPDLTDEALIETLDEWLAPFLAGRTGLDGLPLADALMLAVGPERSADLERLAPSHLQVPTGSRLSLSYPPDGQAPTLAVRVQELYGLTEHPAVLDGAVPIVIELLSPAHRPIQRTANLPAFWSGSWRDVAADMRGRYPKHVWPEDPGSATPTRRAKPR